MNKSTRLFVDICTLLVVFSVVGFVVLSLLHKQTFERTEAVVTNVIKDIEENTYFIGAKVLVPVTEHKDIWYTEIEYVIDGEKYIKVLELKQGYEIGEVIQISYNPNDKEDIEVNT